MPRLLPRFHSRTTMQFDKGRCQLFVNSGTFEALDRLTLWKNGFIFQEGVCRVIQSTVIYDRPPSIMTVQDDGDTERHVPAQPPLVYRASLLLEVTEAFARQHIAQQQAALEIAR